MENKFSRGQVYSNEQGLILMITHVMGQSVCYVTENGFSGFFYIDDDVASMLKKHEGE